MNGAATLQPLTSLTKLENLTIYGLNEVSDFSYLSHLTELKHLKLYDCDKISDFSFLKTLTQLQSFKIGRSPHSHFKYEAKKIIELCPVLTKVRVTVSGRPSKIKLSLDDL